MQIVLERNVPHLACKVWISGFQMFVLIEVVINEPTFPLSHTPTSNVRYIAFSMRTNPVLTPCSRCGTLPCNHLSSYDSL